MTTHARWAWSVTVAGLIACALAIGTALVRAADHADAPDTMEGNLDINDLYVFNDGNDVVFIMTVAPFLTPGEATRTAALNPRGLYEFNLDAQRDGVEESVIQVATAGSGASQTIMVRGPVRPAVTGTTSRIEPGPSLKGRFGSTLSGSGITAWVGPSDDPFFINLFGDRSVRSVLNAAYGAALGRQVGDPSEQTLAFADPAADDLAGLNTLSIVVRLPKQTVADALGIPANGVFYAWATTSVR
ncbi:MAG: DUF4331 domain-containing protein [Gemmatimonadetes bacterium]|nr:DUF4331 domain-containing protein [Gemmatimonadota bacterium]